MKIVSSLLQRLSWETRKIRGVQHLTWLDCKSNALPDDPTAGCKPGSSARGAA
jgi:hypothetical protein